VLTVLESIPVRSSLFIRPQLLEAVLARVRQEYGL